MNISDLGQRPWCDTASFPQLCAYTFCLRLR